MKVCELTQGKELHADQRGEPYLMHPGTGLRPAGWISEVQGED